MPQTDEIRRRAPKAPKKAANGLPRCGAPTARGGVCTAPGTMPDRRCPHHTSTVSEAQKRSWRTRGQAASMRARMPASFTPASFESEEAARRVLEETADLVRAGQMPTSVANAVSKLAGVAARLGELKLAAKLAELEQRLDEAKRR